MNIKNITIACLSLLMLGSGSSFAQEQKLPILIENHFLQGRGLTVLDPEGPTDEGVTAEEPINSSMHLIYSGKISAYIFEVEKGRVRIDGLPYDEFVQVLEGRLILTPDDGEEKIYNKGDSLIVPEGYTGYWTMPEKYRELVVINTIEE